MKEGLVGGHDQREYEVHLYFTGCRIPTQVHGLSKQGAK